MSIFLPSPIPSIDGIDSSTVAIATTVQFKRTSQATRSAAGFIGSRRTVTSDTFVSSTDTDILVDTTAGAVNLRMFRCKEYPSNRVKISRSAGANTVTLTARTPDTIDGAASITIIKTVEVGPMNSTTLHVYSTSA